MLIANYYVHFKFIKPARSKSIHIFEMYNMLKIHLNYYITDEAFTPERH